jgi:hypothetical protein
VTGAAAAPAPEAAGALDRRDAGAAIAAGVIAGIVYVRTLAPGLTADLDAAAFQLVGKVLGVAHNPGYPLYTLLTWPIAQLPAGPLAWRINLFSAAMGAIAVALTALAARRLGSGRIAAAAAGLGFGFGATFWAQAVVAEVYTMHAALIGGALTAAFGWSRTGRPRLFFAAVACVAAGLAHHTTIAAFGPALAVLALLRDRRFALRPRTIGTSLAILALGLLPYLLILVRSRDPEAYVEWRAATLPKLAGVVLGGQFQDRLFTDPWSRAIADRVPLLVERVFVPDLTVPGLVLAAIGAAWLLRRRPAEALCLAAAAVPIAGFALNYAVVDTPVFLIPVLQILWICAAVGADRAAGWLAAGRGRGTPAIAAAITTGSALAVCVLPVWLAVRYLPRMDRSADRDARPLERLFEVLPDRTAIVSADFVTDRMLHYLLLGAGAARGRDIRIAPRDPAVVRRLIDDGLSVVAFPAIGDRLRLDGFDVAAAPVPVFDGPLDAVVGELPRGAIVAIAVPAAHRAAFDRTARHAYARLAAPPPGSGALGLVGVVGGGAPRIQAAPAVDLGLAPRDAPWTPGHGPLQVLAGADLAAVRLAGRDVLRTRGGAAVAVWNPEGRLVRAHAVRAAHGFLVPLPPGALSVHAVTLAAAPTPIASDAWSDVTSAVATGGVAIEVPAGATVEIRAGDVHPLAPRVEVNRGRGPVRIETRPAGGDPVAGLPWLSRIGVGAEPAGPVAVWLALGGVPRRALARVTGGGPARLAPVSASGVVGDAAGGSAVLAMNRGEAARAVGAGWSDVESDDAGPYRWVVAPRARLLVSRPRVPWRTIRVEAFRPDGPGPATLAVGLGDRLLAPLPLRPGWAAYEWAVPPEAAVELTAPAVDVALVVDAGAVPPAPGPRLIAVAALRFAE